MKITIEIPDETLRPTDSRTLGLFMGHPILRDDSLPIGKFRIGWNGTDLLHSDKHLMDRIRYISRMLHGVGLSDTILTIFCSAHTAQRLELMLPYPRSL